MRILVFIAVSIALFFSSSALASDCEQDSIDEVSSSGGIIKTISGHVYEVDDTDKVDSALWTPSDDILICDQVGNSVIIINTDEDGEKVEANLLN